MRSSTFAFSLTVAAAWLVAGAALAAALEAGVARVDLTPPEEFKAALGGYGARMSKPAEGVHDRVFAKALVVADGPKRFAVVTADVLGFPPAFKPALVGRLSEAGWTADQIMLLPSHSHSSIDISAINPANVFGVLMSLEPAVAALIGFLALSQDLALIEVVAIGLVVAASAGALRSASTPAPRDV